MLAHFSTVFSLENGMEKQTDNLSTRVVNSGGEINTTCG